MSGNLEVKLTDYALEFALWRSREIFKINKIWENYVLGQRPWFPEGTTWERVWVCACVRDLFLIFASG